MTRQGACTEHAAASGSSSGFEIASGSDVNALGTKCSTETCGDRGNEIALFGRSGAEAMVDMDSRDVEPCGGGENK